MCGTLSSVDQYLNLKLKEVTVNDGEKHPHMVKYQFIIDSFKYEKKILQFANF